MIMAGSMTKPLEDAFEYSPRQKRKLLYYWFAMALLVLLVDYGAGPFIQFPIFYVFPVALSQWYNGKWWGFLYAIALPLVRLYFNTVWQIPWTMFEGTINALIRITVLCILAYLVDRAAAETKSLKREVKVLEGLLPICVSCKKIRDDNEEWQPLEKYISEHSEATFTHGVCKDCAKKLYGVELPDLSKKKSKK
jgi:hypothetical protein